MPQHAPRIGAQDVGERRVSGVRRGRAFTLSAGTAAGRQRLTVNQRAVSGVRTAAQYVVPYGGPYGDKSQELIRSVSRVDRQLGD